MSNTESTLKPSTAQRIPRVLIVDDDEIVALSLRHHSERAGLAIEFIYAADVGDGVKRLNEQCYDAAVIDVCLPGLPGVTLGELIRECDPLIPLAYLTNLDSDAVKTEASQQRALYLFKQQYWCDDDGMRALVNLVGEMAKLNPCLSGGVRVGKDGFPRQLKTTPLEVPYELRRLLEYGKKVMARAA